MDTWTAAATAVVFVYVAVSCWLLRRQPDLWRPAAHDQALVAGIALSVQVPVVLFSPDLPSVAARTVSLALAGLGAAVVVTARLPPRWALAHVAVCLAAAALSIVSVSRAFLVTPLVVGVAGFLTSSAARLRQRP